MVGSNVTTFEDNLRTNYKFGTKKLCTYVVHWYSQPFMENFVWLSYLR